MKEKEIHNSEQLEAWGTAIEESMNIIGDALLIRNVLPPCEITLLLQSLAEAAIERRQFNCCSDAASCNHIRKGDCYAVPTNRR